MGKGFLSALILLSCGTTVSAWTPPLAIQSVTIKHYGPNEFTRISEFFTGCENTGGDTIVRTDEASRSGLYLVLKLTRAVCDLGEDAELTFRYILSDFKQEKSQTFMLRPVAGRSRWLFIGVTGSEYHGGAQALMAWSVELDSKEGSVVQESYLWKMGQQIEPNCSDFSGDFK